MKRDRSEQAEGEAEDVAELSAKDGKGYCMASVHRRGSADAIDGSASIEVDG